MKSRKTLTVSFLVFFDQKGEARISALDGDTNILEVTITGNRPQIQGFVCLFFAQYGSDGLRSEDLWSDRLRGYHISHYYDHIDAARISAMNQRYVISLLGVTDGQGLQFLTSDLADFVSGMRAVPSLIELKEQAPQDLVPTMTVIKPQYLEENWLDVYNYLDLHDPAQYALYTDDGDDDDPFLDSPTLRTIDLTQTPPITFSIKRNNYVVPDVTVGQYLDRCDRGRIPKIQAHVLKVAYWEEGWKVSYSQGISEICHRLKIKVLRSAFRRIPEAYPSLAKQSSSDRYPFLSELREVEMACSDVITNFWDLIHNSRTRRLTYRLIIGLVNATEPSYILSRADLVLEDIYDNNILDNYGLRELLFSTIDSPEPVSYAILNPTDTTHKGRVVLDVLARNQKAFEKCVNAVVTLIGIRRKRQTAINHEILSLIIWELWKTRCTEGWAKE